jgi:hypothetical protein
MKRGDEHRSNFSVRQCFCHLKSFLVFLKTEAQQSLSLFRNHGKTTGPGQPFLFLTRLVRRCGIANPAPCICMDGLVGLESFVCRLNDPRAIFIAARA